LPSYNLELAVEKYPLFIISLLRTIIRQVSLPKRGGKENGCQSCNKKYSNLWYLLDPHQMVKSELEENDFGHGENLNTIGLL